MAVTSIWPVKVRLDRVINYIRNPEKTIDSSYTQLASLHQIDGVIQYAANDMKTEKRMLVTGINCSEPGAAAQFLETQKIHTKTGGRICYHGYQSFRPGEVTAETAHKIGVELAERLWGDRFEVLVATHCNTGAYHNHFVLNAVSYHDGLKFYNSHADYRRMRLESDRLCREYGISVVEQANGISRSYAEWQAGKNGVPTRRDMIRADIDRAIQASATERQFMEVMTAMGYQFKLRGSDGQRLKRPSLKPHGAKGFFRFQNLGEGYSLEEIIHRVYSNVHRRDPFPEFETEPRKKYAFDSTTPVRKLHGLRALYIRYCFELHIIKRHPTSTKRVPFSLREDLIKLDRLDAEARLLGDNGIDTAEQLNTYRDTLRARMEALTAQRKELRNRLRREQRKPDQTGVPVIQAQISESSSQLKQLRREISLCDEIEARSAQVQVNLEQLEQEQNAERTEQTVVPPHCRSHRPERSY